MELFLVTLLAVGLAVLLLGVRLFFVRGGRFPNTHIGSSKAMRERGIGCATSQDREAQRGEIRHKNSRKTLKN